jgi:hypothetical protein
MDVNGQLHAPAALPTVSLDKRLGVLQRRSERYGVEKSLLPLLGMEPWSVAISTDLFRLHNYQVHSV